MTDVPAGPSVILPEGNQLFLAPNQEPNSNLLEILDPQWIEWFRDFFEDLLERRAQGVIGDDFAGWDTVDPFGPPLDPQTDLPFFADEPPPVDDDSGQSQTDPPRGGDGEGSPFN